MLSQPLPPVNLLVRESGSREGQRLSVKEVDKIGISPL
jgi:hypothetical protein